MKKFLFYKKNLNTGRVRKHPFFTVDCENIDEAKKSFEVYERGYHPDSIAKNEELVIKETYIIK